MCSFVFHERTDCYRRRRRRRRAKTAATMTNRYGWWRSGGWQLVVSTAPVIRRGGGPMFWRAFYSIPSPRVFRPSVRVFGTPAHPPPRRRRTGRSVRQGSSAGGRRWECAQGTAVRCPRGRFSHAYLLLPLLLLLLLLRLLRVVQPARNAAKGFMFGLFRRAVIENTWAGGGGAEAP